MFDVAVIGAGPAGSMTAQRLAFHGHSVILLEEHDGPGDPVNCSGIIGMEAFQHFNLPRSPIVREIDSIRFYSPAGMMIEYHHPQSLAAAVDRSAFDIEMAKKAVTSGALLRTASHVSRIDLQKHRVRLTINRDQSFVESRFVVIATGAGSKLTKQVGLENPKKYVLGAQTEIRTVDVNDVEIHLGHEIAPYNFAWIVPLKNQYAKVGLICKKDGSLTLKSFLKRLAAKGRIILGRPRIQCSLLPLETLSRTYADRTIVVGEAAGQIKTITCGGIYYGLLAAEIAADVLHQSLKNCNFHASQLAIYEKRWKDLFQQELEIGSRLRLIFEHLSDRKINALFEVAGKNGLMRLIQEKANFDWHKDLVTEVFRHSLVRVLFEPWKYRKLFL